MVPALLIQPPRVKMLPPGSLMRARSPPSSKQVQITSPILWRVSELSGLDNCFAAGAIPWFVELEGLIERLLSAASRGRARERWKSRIPLLFPKNHPRGLCVFFMKDINRSLGGVSLPKGSGEVCVSQRRCIPEM